MRAATSPEPEPRGSQVLRLAASRGGPRNALGHRPEPEVLPLPAETSREAPKCCAWQHQGGGAQTKCCAWQHQGRGGPETRSGTVQSLKCCCQQSREAPKCCAWQHQEGGPETRSKCCPCQQKRAKCCAWHQGRGPRTRSGTVQSLKCCPCQQKPGSIRAPKRARVPSRA